MVKIYPKVSVKSTILKNIKKTNTSLPIMDKPIAGHLNLQFEPITNPLLIHGYHSYEIRRQLQQEETAKREAKLKAEETARLNAEQQRIDIEKKQKEIELKNATVELQDLYNTYIKFVPNPITLNLTAIKTHGIVEIKKCVASLHEDIEREQMMQGLETEFTKGALFYYPQKPNNNRQEEYDPFALSNLTDIQPRPNAMYDKEYARLTSIFISNSAKIDEAIIIFNEISKNFQTEAAKSLKEIFGLQTDNINEWLERIPKLGLIPKMLRVSEQIRLSKCIIEDYKSVSEEFIDKKLIPLINKYNSQYKIIQKYIAQYKQQYDAQIEINNQLIKNTNWWQFKKRRKYKKQNKKLEQAKIIDKTIRDLYKQKIEATKQQRQNVATQSVNVFARSGMNINNICKSVQTRGIIDVARKAVFTLIPFCC